MPVVAGTRDLRITLAPAPFFEAVNVTSSRTDVPKVDPTVTVSVCTASDLMATGSITIDDALKRLFRVFTLFRRTLSRVSNPTAQGITLRGLGGTGSSRSLVLADGVPLNDAFGGWVYHGTNCRKPRSIASRFSAGAAATCMAPTPSAASSNC